MNRQEFTNKCKEIVGKYDERIGIRLIPFILDGAPDENGRFPEHESIPPHKMADYEAGRIYDFLEEHNLFKKEVTEEVYPTPTKISEILIVEDGSCDVDILKKQGYKIIVYRQGSRPPYFMQDNRSNNSYYAGACLLTNRENNNENN